MRILIVDNYDSFTFNLFQLVARVTGTEPIVVRNDQHTWPDLHALGCDAVVVSPGPGRPEKAADFGISAQIMQDPRVPVLGVCLGHQGIAHYFGGEVAHAPEPMHGRTSPVLHTGTDLFEGIPQGFDVVRYHSLLVREPLPACLERIAWTSDGVLMGLRHRERPIWGVQFHPESVSTQFGERLLENFVALSRAAAPTAPGLWTASKRKISVVPPAMPSTEDLFEHRLVTRRLPALVTAEQAFETLFAREPKAVWLDSSRVEPGLARFSFLGAPLGPLGQEVTYRVAKRELTVTKGGETTTRVGSVFDYLEEQILRHHVEADDLPFDFACGFAGYLGYELKAECGGEARHASPHADAELVLADRLVVVDHETGELWLVALVDATPESARLAQAWLDATEGRLRDVAALPPPERSTPAPGSPLALRWSRDHARYLADLDACLRSIGDGETYEVCLTNVLRARTTVDPLDFYKNLRRSNPAPYSSFLRFGKLTVASSSPERFLRIDRASMVEAKPIKGTAKRGLTPEADARAAEELAACEKTRSENLMITDLLRNDLGIVCEVGSVHVPRLMAIESYATVHQLVSTIRGRLRRGVSPVECVRASFPGGSMTGAPKVRTMRILDDLEHEARGIYSGAIGYFSLDGVVDLNIVIRTAVFADGEVTVGVGGAVVALSEPADEYDEIVLKARALVRALLVTNGEADVDARLDGIEQGLREAAPPPAALASA